MPLESFAILTTAPNELVALTHDWVMVIIDRNEFSTRLMSSEKKGGKLMRP